MTEKAEKRAAATVFAVNQAVSKDEGTTHDNNPSALQRLRNFWNCVANAMQKIPVRSCAVLVSCLLSRPSCCRVYQHSLRIKQNK